MTIKKAAKYLVLSHVVFVTIIIIVGGGFGPNESKIADSNNVLLFAHRGISEFNIENSEEAFDSAKLVGFNAIETDVRSTKDGRLIIFHDDTYHHRMRINRDVKDVNWHEIKDVYLKYRGKDTDQKILTLEHFLESQHDSIFIYLDVKEFSIQIADNLLAILSKYSNRKNIIIADGSIFYLVYLKLKESETTVAWEGFNKGKEWLYHIIPQNFKPDYYASSISAIDKNHMLFLANNNLLDRKIVYGVNRKNISEAYKFGVHNIIYDYSGRGSNVEKIKSLLLENKYN